LIKTILEKNSSATRSLGKGWRHIRGTLTPSLFAELRRTGTTRLRFQLRSDKARLRPDRAASEKADLSGPLAPPPQTPYNKGKIRLSVK